MSEPCRGKVNVDELVTGFHVETKVKPAPLFSSVVPEFLLIAEEASVCRALNCSVVPFWPTVRPVVVIFYERDEMPDAV